MRRGVLLVILALALVGYGSGSVARADSGGATVRTLPESSELQANVTVEHSCPGYSYGPTETCDWFGEAAAYGAESGCPQVFDVSRGIWVGTPETAPGSSTGSFAFSTFGLPRDVVVCLYVHSEGDELVGKSHPFDQQTGREILSAPSEPVASGCGKLKARGLSWQISVQGNERCPIARREMSHFLSQSKRSRTLRTGWRCTRGTQDGEPIATCSRHSASIVAFGK